MTLMSDRPWPGQDILHFGKHSMRNNYGLLGKLGRIQLT
jgi:hypothetical protein